MDVELAGKGVIRRSPSPLILSLGERKSISPALRIGVKTLILPDVGSSNDILIYGKTPIAGLFSLRFQYAQIVKSSRNLSRVRLEFNDDLSFSGNHFCG